MKIVNKDILKYKALKEFSDLVKFHLNNDSMKPMADESSYKNQLRIYNELRSEAKRIIQAHAECFELPKQNSDPIEGCKDLLYWSLMRPIYYKPPTIREKISLITDAVRINTNASAKEIAQSTGIDETTVRKLCGGVKKKMKTGGSKQNIKVQCDICQCPLSWHFKCDICKEIIKNECKECHYTNYHPNYTIP